MTRKLETLAEMIGFASDSAARLFRQKGVIYPMYHAIKANGEHFVSLMPPAPNKDTAIALVKSLFEIEQVDRYVFIDEAWMLFARPDQDISSITSGKSSVSEHPDRREVVQFIAENRKGVVLQAHRFILRPEIGKPSLSPLKTFSPSESGGRMVGLLRRLS